MADNVNVTAGTGTVIATDQVGADHYQKVKLADGTADSSTMVGVDVGAKANALRVAPANDITDGTYIGDIKFGEAEPNSAAILADTTAILADTAAIQTAVELLDNAVDGNYLNVNVNLAGTDVTAGAGAVAAGTPRMTLASDDPAVALLTTIDSDTSAIKTAIELLDNAIAGNEMQVDVVAALPAGDNNIGNVDIASSVALDVSAATVTVDLGANNDVVCAGDVAHDGGDSGNPIKVGGKAFNFDGTAPGTAVAENDRANFITDVYGRQFVETIHPAFGTATDNQAAAQTKTALVAAQGAGLSIYVTDIIMSVDTAGNIKLVEDTAGAGTDIKGPYYFAANGGMAISLKSPLKVGANVDIGYTSSMNGNHTVEIGYFVAPG